MASFTPHLHVPLESAPASQLEAGASEHIRLERLWHRYSQNAEADWILREINLVVRHGELIGLLGPSGCGKTTLLRLIAGFERPRLGRVLLEGQEVAGPSRWLPPERRGVGMVFQDHALFPHLNAWRNACFGIGRGQDRDRARWLLELLGLGGLEQRFPHQLSGGQRQRLALVRALAPQPSLLLLDEPFSNLDVEVRQRLRAELPLVLARCGCTGLLVTHDPQEALAICDRVAVLESGQLHQCAAPRQLVEEPASAFVGRFVLQSNLLPAHWQDSRVVTPFGLLVPLPRDGDGVPAEALNRDGNNAGEASALDVQGDLSVLVDAEALQLIPDPSAEDWVFSREFQGDGWWLQVQRGGQRFRLRMGLHQGQTVERGARCRLVLRPGARGRLFPAGLPLRALGTE
ncbi:MAG: ABC transporter ATP-binding protein [Synechococcaceae cyanobacterium]|jgi:iron(III) transport system ATP-binding protein